MTDFQLDPRLAADCILLGEMPLSLLLLMNNALVPWFILVPRRSATELCELDHSDQVLLLGEINLVSNHVRNIMGAEKLNIAAIGNMVRQLHVHVVGRNVSDYRWPGVVWGAKETRPYSPGELNMLLDSLDRSLPGDTFRKACRP